MTSTLDGARGELLAQLPKWKAHLQKQVDDGSVYCGHMPDARAVLALIEMIERRAAPVPQCDADRERLRDTIAKHQKCFMPCACLRNTQPSDCAALADAILALVSPPSEAGREMVHRTSDAPEQRSGHPSAENDAT